MKTTLNRRGESLRYVVKLDRNEQIDEREMDMLLSGTAPALLPPIGGKRRRTGTITYDVSDLLPLSGYLHYSRSNRQLTDLLLQFVAAFQTVQDCDLDFGKLSLDFDRVYFSTADGRIRLLYFPLNVRDPEQSLRGFFMELLKKARCDNDEQAQFTEEHLQWLHRSPTLDMQAFRARLLGAKAPEPQPDEDDEDEGEKTVVLVSTAPKKERFFLLRERTKEMIELAVSPFEIGTDTRSVSYRIAKNKFVSRRHVKLEILGGVCTITDLHSTNKTYVNRKAIAPNVAFTLKNGDAILIADEPFTFFSEKEK